MANVFRQTGATKRNAVSKLIPEIRHRDVSAFDQFLSRPDANRARRDVVDAYSVLRHIQRKRTDGTIQSGLQTAVQAILRIRLFAARGCNIDNVSLGSAGNHIVGSFPHHQNIVFEIQIDQQIQRLFLNVLKRFEDRQSGVVDQQIQSTEIRHGSIKEGFARAFFLKRSLIGKASRVIRFGNLFYDLIRFFFFADV